MEKIKKILLSLFCCIYLGQTSGQVSYHDIINSQDPRLPYSNNSLIARQFNLCRTRKEKIHYLVSLCTPREDGKLTLTIRDIPQKNGAPAGSADLTLAFVDPQDRDNVNELKGYDSALETPGEQLLRVEFNGPDTFMLWPLTTPKAVLGGIVTIENIAGSTVMRIFDGLSSLCRLGKVSLVDVSTLPEIELINSESDENQSGEYLETTVYLQKLYPYIYGRTFYERYGFKPAGLSPEGYADYIQKKDYLTHRPLTEVLHDFSNDPTVYNALAQGYRELRFFPEHNKPLGQATIRDALYALYVRIKIPFNQHDLPPGAQSHYDYLTLLCTIYENCLADYTSTIDPEKSALIKRYQSESTSVFWTKEYV